MITPAQRGERQDELADGRAVLLGDVEDEAVVGERQDDVVGAAVVADDLEVVALEQVEDRDLALVVRIGPCGARLFSSISIEAMRDLLVI